TPMGIPSRIRKFAIDLLARVITGFWPVIVAKSPEAVSMARGFSRASPRPMFRVIFCRRGSSMGFLYSNSFWRAGTTCRAYCSWTRVANVALVNVGSAALANPHLDAIRTNPAAGTRRLLALLADHHQVGLVNRRF